MMGIPAIAFTALLYGILTPFGWAFFFGLASLIMAVQVIGGEMRKVAQ